MTFLMALLISGFSHGINISSESYIMEAHWVQPEQATLSINGQRKVHLTNGVVGRVRNVTGVSQMVELPIRYCEKHYGADNCASAKP